MQTVLVASQFYQLGHRPELRSCYTYYITNPIASLNYSLQLIESGRYLIQSTIDTLRSIYPLADVKMDAAI